MANGHPFEQKLAHMRMVEQEHGGTNPDALIPRTRRALCEHWLRSRLRRECADFFRTLSFLSTRKH